MLSLYRTIQIHRNNIIHDMVEAFHDKKLLDVKIKIEMIGENAEDLKGLFRDTLTQFWDELANRHFEGIRQSVPVACPQFNTSDWKAIGAILFKGYKQLNFFPLRLSKATVMYILFGHVSQSDLLDSFYSYLSSNESDTLKAVLGTGNCPNFDTVLGVMSSFRVTVIVNKENLQDQIHRCARVALIERAELQMDKMNVRKMKSFAAFSQPEKVRDLYDKLTPTPDKVVAMLSAKIRNQQQTDSYEYLVKSIHDMNREKLSRFLRFSTGSDNLLVPKITVKFVTMRPFVRRLTAHVCISTIYVPINYATFNEFNSELNLLLYSNNWEMDFV